jgi:hypothetical protein
MASLGEETRASCRGPSNLNAIALILPHKSMIGFGGGALGADIYCDRTAIHCRTIAECAKVLDALKDAVEGYYDPRDIFTTVPRSSVLNRHRRRTAGHAAWRDSRVDDRAAGFDDRGADHRRSGPKRVLLKRRSATWSRGDCPPGAG